MFKHNLLCHPCSWARNEVNDHLRSPATETDLLNCQSILLKQNLLLAQVFLYCSDTAQPSLSHCYFTQAMLQQWPFPLLPLPSPWPPHWHGMAWCGMVWYGIVASSLADLKASSHSLQTQQNIDLNPKETIPFKTLCPKILETAKMLLKSSQSCGFDFAKNVFWIFVNLPETEVCFRRAAAASGWMSGGVQFLFALLSNCMVDA